MMAILVALLGFVFGSFAGAQVWRLRARQLIEDRQAKEQYDKAEYKKLEGLMHRKGTDDRSQCLHCHHVLAWYDLVPILSWLSTRGRCRYCRRPIGLFEPAIELATAAYFVVSFLFWPVALNDTIAVLQFIIWLIAGVMLIVLFAYDMKWFLLPDRIVFPLIGLAIVSFGLDVLHFSQSTSIMASLLDGFGAIAILSGIYYILWLVSKGKWIGFGDVKLGIALGLLLGHWELAFLALFLANFIGFLIVLPGLLSKKLSRTTRIPFGPMLIAGFFIAALWGDTIVSWYLSTTITLML